MEEITVMLDTVGSELIYKTGQWRDSLIMNPDVRVAHDAILEGINYLETHDSVVALSPWCRSASGSRKYLCKSYPSIFNLFLRGRSRWVEAIQGPFVSL